MTSLSLFSDLSPRCLQISVLGIQASTLKAPITSVTDGILTYLLVVVVVVVVFRENKAKQTTR